MVLVQKNDLFFLYLMFFTLMCIIIGNDLEKNKHQLPIGRLIILHCIFYTFSPLLEAADENRFSSVKCEYVPQSGNVG